jgi:hypothetical protein
VRQVRASDVLTIGQRFGRWRVTGWTVRRTAFVECECGKRGSVRLARLLAGGGRYGCGCGRHDQAGAPADVLDRGRANSAASRRARILERVASGRKRCGRCQQVKPLDEFWRAPSQPDGHDGYCKACRRYKLRESYWRKKDALPKQLSDIPDVELRCTTLVMSRRLGLDVEHAYRVAALVEPRRSGGYEFDRVEVAARLFRPALEELARKAGVRVPPNRHRAAAWHPAVDARSHVRHVGGCPQKHAVTCGFRLLWVMGHLD